jgi:hypothetical protein
MAEARTRNSMHMHAQPVLAPTHYSRCASGYSHHMLRNPLCLTVLVCVMCLQMKQYDMMTIDAGMQPPDPQDAEYSWDTEEIRDFHRAMEVRGSLMLLYTS